MSTPEMRAYEYMSGPATSVGNISGGVDVFPASGMTHEIDSVIGDRINPVV